MRTKIEIKIKLNQNLRDKIENKNIQKIYIAIKRLKTKFYIINK
jgi:hypothetical protein